MKIITLFLALFLVSFSVQADDVYVSDGSYAVQLGAYKNPDMTIFSILDEYGTVYTEASADGLTRIKLGNYASRSEAESVLKAIRNIGYRDAFLSPAGDAVSSIDSDIPMAEIVSHVPSSFSYGREGYVNPESLPIWSQLSDYQRENVIYLDGVLHIDEDGQFIPLSDYARRVMQ